MTDPTTPPMSEERLKEIEDAVAGLLRLTQANVPNMIVRELVAEVRLQRAGRKRALDAANAALDQRDSLAARVQELERALDGKEQTCRPK